MLKRRIGAFATAFALTVMVMPLEAQQRGPGGRGPSLDDQMTQLSELLELDEKQSRSVRAVLEMQAEKRAEMFSAGGGDRESMRAAMMELREETNMHLTEILTEDQMTKYREFQARRGQRRGPPFGR